MKTKVLTLVVGLFLAVGCGQLEEETGPAPEATTTASTTTDGGDGGSSPTAAAPRAVLDQQRDESAQRARKEPTRDLILWTAINH
jgi:hypothetical protein